MIMLHPFLRHGGLHLCFGLALLIAPARALAQDDSPEQAGRRIVALTSLAAKEYAAGVQDGSVVAQEELDEAVLFLREAQQLSSRLDAAIAASSLTLIDSALTLVGKIAPPPLVASLADSVAHALHAALPGIAQTLPVFRPDSAEGARVFAQSCASCHGEAGRGDGPAGTALEPPPSDLTDRRLLSDQSPLDFYRKVLIGVSGTAMPGFEGRLTERDIWSVAWYATRLRYSADEVARGEILFWSFCSECARDDVLLLVAQLPAEVADVDIAAVTADDDVLQALRISNVASSDGRAGIESDASLVAFLRTLPFAPSRVEGTDSVFAAVNAELARSLRAARDGDRQAAAAKVLDAYVAFEAVETDIAVRDNSVARTLELAFSELRSRVASDEPIPALAESYVALSDELAHGQRVLAARTSNAGLFAQSFILLVREGIEALLIVGALITLVLHAGAKKRRKEIWWGVAIAIVASLLTAVLLESVFRLGAAQQEMLEGATMLVAAGVLLFVSFWLISKVEAARWSAFLQAHGTRALREGSMYALGAAAFLAVYREGFETVLFYKALMITAGTTGIPSVATGALAGAAALAALYYAITAFGFRIPLRAFFAVTSAILMYMAFSFAGKGIAELQEGGVIGATLLDWAPRAPWLGLYPTTQTLMLQLAILSLIIGGLVWTFVVAPRFLQTAGKS